MVISRLKFYILTSNGNYHDALTRFYLVSEKASHIGIFTVHSYNVSALLSLCSDYDRSYCIIAAHTCHSIGGESQTRQAPLVMGTGTDASVTVAQPSTGK